MDKKTEALKLALEALEGFEPNTFIGSDAELLCHAAITAIREALAEQPAIKQDLTTEQPTQEPVAWRLWDEDPLGGMDHRWAYYDKSDFVEGVDPAKHFKVEPLYTSPPASKPWVGLSTDEIYDMYNEPRSDAEMVEFARAIEAKLKEKNK